MYDKSSLQYLQNNSVLSEARMFLRNSIVDNDELRSLIIVLDSRSPMLARTLTGKKQDKLLTTVKQNVIADNSQTKCKGVPFSSM